MLPCVTEARHQDHSSGYIYIYITSGLTPFKKKSNPPPRRLRLCDRQHHLPCVRSHIHQQGATAERRGRGGWRGAKGR